MLVVDTGVVSELRKAKSGRADPAVVAWARSVQASELFVSAITILELETGVLQIERRDATRSRVDCCAHGWINRCYQASLAGSWRSIPP